MRPPWLEGNGEGVRLSTSNTLKERFMQWTTPQASEMRFGFEVTMYIAAR